MRIEKIQDKVDKIATEFLYKYPHLLGSSKDACSVYLRIQGGHYADVRMQFYHMHPKEPTFNRESAEWLYQKVTEFFPNRGRLITMNPARSKWRKKGVVDTYYTLREVPWTSIPTMHLTVHFRIPFVISGIRNGSFCETSWSIDIKPPTNHDIVASQVL